MQRRSLLVATVVFLLVANTGAAWQKPVTHTVFGTNNAAFDEPNLQAAIDAANPGDSPGPDPRSRAWLQTDRGLSPTPRRAYPQEPRNRAGSLGPPVRWKTCRDRGAESITQPQPLAQSYPAAMLHTSPPLGRDVPGRILHASPALLLLLTPPRGAQASSASCQHYSIRDGVL